MEFNSSQLIPEVVISVIVTIVIFIVCATLEQVYKLWNGFENIRVPIMPFTLASGSGPIVYVQDPCLKDMTDTDSRIYLPLKQSENQLTGIEFSYTTFIYASPDSVVSSDTADTLSGGWKSVFYKGYETGSAPLMSPGVFIRSDNTSNSTPTLRVVMNTYDSWYNTIDVEQIPFNKWFHLAIVLRSSVIEVYINGNLANRMNFKGTLPYQNYQPLVVLPTTTYLSSEFTPRDTMKRGIAPGDSMAVSGVFTGYISNLYYFSYALTYAEIQQMMQMGPSTKVKTASLDLPPYLIDTWWTQQKN
jgi:hypothetical protein